MTTRLDYSQSLSREKLLEYVFLSELLQEAWCVRNWTIDILRPDVDRACYDLALECNGIRRYVQLKGSRHDARTRQVTVNAELASKPGGCVLWLSYQNVGGRIKLQYKYMGGHPSQCPNLGDKRGRRTTPDFRGEKPERENTRVLKKTAFTPLPDIGMLMDKLFPSTNS